MTDTRNTDNIVATYSAEDNKLRLYPVIRLDGETYARVKEAGFKWAPKQELFVAPKWTPQREDLCLELAGEIYPEETTMAERAAIKAERLDGYAERRSRDANAFSRAADDLSQAFYGGQPILVGHHSERKARKTQERMHNAMDKSVKASKAADYWLYRAEGVERHANHKNSPKTRRNRIETLLKELRDWQRHKNHCATVYRLWDKATDDTKIAALADAYSSGGQLAAYELREAFKAGNISAQELREKAMDAAQRGMESPKLHRWIDHILNRLSFERSMLGPVSRFDGTLTATMIQTFARTHGAEKPSAKATENGFALTSPVPLPLHFANGNTLSLTAAEWCDLMENTGYEVPKKAPAKAPILNFKAESLQRVNRWNGNIETLEQITMTKEEYRRLTLRDSAWIVLSACGRYRFRTASDPAHKGPYFSAPRRAVYLSDSKEHPAPAPVEADAEAA